MQKSLLLATIFLILLINTNCFLQEQDQEEQILEAIEDFVDYRKEINQQKLGLDQECDDENQEEEEQEDLGQWLGNYSVGSQCYSSSCEISYFFNTNNEFKCPKSEKSGVIGYRPQDKKYFLSFMAYWRGFYSNKPFFITFDDSHKVKTQEGYKYQIPMHKGYYLNIEPCHYNRYRDQRFNLCPQLPKYPELIVYKTYSDSYKNSYDLRYCTFTMKRYYGYNKHCLRKWFVKTLVQTGVDVILA